MITTTSFSKDGRFSSIFKNALKSQLPFAITSLIVMLLSITAVYFAGISSLDKYLATLKPEEVQRILVDRFRSGIHMSDGVVYLPAYLLALVAFASVSAGLAYMHSKKRVDLYHALPVSRGRLLVANMLASLVATLVPYVAVFFTTMLLQITKFSNTGCLTTQYYQNSLLDLATVIIFILVICAFTAFINVQVGTVIDSLMITGVLGLAPLFIYLLLGKLWENATYGAIYQSEYAFLLSPFTFILSRVLHGTYIARTIHIDYAGILLEYVIWLVIGILLFASALLLYKRRRSEIAAQTQPKGILQTIVKCFAAFCGALLLYFIFYRYGIVFKVIGMLVGAVIVGIVAELVFSRGARYLIKNLKWLAGGGALTCVIVLCLIYDAFGYVSRVPEIEQVDSVELSYSGRFSNMAGNSDYGVTYRSYGIIDLPVNEKGSLDRRLNLQDSIGIVLDMHQKAVENPPPQETDYYIAMTEEAHPYTYIEITYNLSDGGTMTRRYNRVYIEALLALANLEDKDDFISVNHPLFWMDKMSIPQVDMINSVGVNNSFQAGRDIPMELSKEELRALLDALQQDMLLESLSEIKTPSKPALGYVFLSYKTRSDLYYLNLIEEHPDLEFYEMGRNQNMVAVLVTEEYQNTIAFLKANGVYDQMVNAPAPEKLYLISTLDYGIGEYNRVNTVGKYSVQDSYNRDYIRQYKDGTLSARKEVQDGVGNEVFEISDPAAIAQIGEKASNQLLLGSHTSKDYIIVYAEYEGEISGYKYMKVEELPAPLREQVQSYADELYRYRFENTPDAVYG